MTHFEETSKNRNFRHHVLNHITFRQFAIEAIGLKLAADIDSCRPLWEAELLKDGADVIKLPNDEYLLGRYSGMSGGHGWEQTLGATRRQKCELSTADDLKDFQSASDSMLTMLSFLVSLFCALVLIHRFEFESVIR